MMIARKPIGRRTLLRGLGACLALPLMEGMSSSAKAAEAAAAACKRFQVIYLPNGMVMQNWTPAELGENYTLSPILKPMAPFRDKFAVIKNLDHVMAEAMGDGAGDHARCCATFLTGVHIYKSDSVLLNGPSMDQLVARKTGQYTQIASLELGLNQPSMVGSCDAGYSCAYNNTMSWTDPKTPLPITVNPREVFERLFGDGDQVDAHTRRRQLLRQASLLDFIAEDARRFSVNLGARDKQKLDEYMTSVRDVERRIQMAESQNAVALPKMVRPSGIPESFSAYARMMIDLQVLAMQTDLTRVATFMFGRENGATSYPETGVPDGHHPLSHHQNNPDKLADLTKINTYHMEQVAYYFKRMSETRDGEASLLDSTLVLAGASLADPNRHEHRDLPIIVGGGGLKGNRHIDAKSIPMTNLLLTMMDQMGVNEEKLGDSTGRMAGLV
ncbi:MAG TPA: DUF1552 domain-containing protein [Rhizomicrobium sp.]|nr:DUF1552 domain-containing protein [Rhizomicrobium sp.]